MIPIIDLEASSLSTNSFPIEVGIFLPEEDSYINESWLIKPTNDWLENRKWDENSAKVHNISKDELINNGISGYDVCLKLNSLLNGTVIYSDAPDYDYMWLKILFNEWDIDMLFGVGNMLYPEIPKFDEKLSKMNFKQFDEVKNEIIKKHKITLHRAKDDALMLGLIMKEFLK